MRIRFISAVCFAFATCAFFFPKLACAQTPENTSNSNMKLNSAEAEREAARMVPAEAVLAQGINAKKMQPGEQFQARLTDTVLLKNGVELPKGTTLVGTIAIDKMQAGGTSTLALRFTKAELKDGKTIPVEAAIMGISQPLYGDTWDDDQASWLAWNGKTLRVDEPSVMSGVDFHGRIAGRNSGVFVSTKKDDLEVPDQSSLSLAIAPQGTNRASGGA